MQLEDSVFYIIVLKQMIAFRLHIAIIFGILIAKGSVSMARTSNVFARVEPEIKKEAEEILDQLGIPMSNAVGMFLRQIVMQKGIPFEMKLPDNTPLAYGGLSKEQFDREIEKGLADVKNGNVVSADDVEAHIRQKYGE